MCWERNLRVVGVKQYSKVGRKDKDIWRKGLRRKTCLNYSWVIQHAVSIAMDEKGRELKSCSVAILHLFEKRMRKTTKILSGTPSMQTYSVTCYTDMISRNKRGVRRDEGSAYRQMVGRMRDCQIS